jgi:Zn-dependent alcohol dehydrogenase
MPVPTDSPSRELDLALARVAQADRQLVTAAEQSYRRARSAAVAGAVTMGIGAALIGTLAGSTGRRRLVSGVLGVALPFVASAVADVVGQIGKSQLNEEKAE